MYKGIQKIRFNYDFAGFGGSTVRSSRGGEEGEAAAGFFSFLTLG